MALNMVINRCNANDHDADNSGYSLSQVSGMLILCMFYL